MKSRSKLLWLFPRAWRARYGEEFEALLEDIGTSPRALLDVLIAALRARLTGPGPRSARLATGVMQAPGGGTGMLVRAFLALAVIAAISAVLLFVLHSFAYLLVAILAVIFALAGGVAKVVETQSSQTSR